MPHLPGSASMEPAEIQAYYQSTVGTEFQNLDDPTTLNGLLDRVQDSSSRNFVLDFGDAAAFTGFDLSSAAIDALINDDRLESLYTRWINIWQPSRQKSLVEVLAKRYDFSPRLLALMTSDPTEPRESRSLPPLPRIARRHFWNRASPTIASEFRVGKELDDELAELASISSRSSVAEGNLYRIINDIWHFSSIDQGRNFVCVGYNSLYGTKHAGYECSDGPLPQCIRVWTWLILCEDNTVISINEDPFPFSSGRLSALQQRVLTEIRRNPGNVFRSLSNIKDENLTRENPMGMFPIRARVGNTPEETAHRPSDMPGLLFYYLFENWHNSYTLITRRESRYGVELNNMRREMFESPKLCHIDRLDAVGTELGVLKRHYESYNRLIDRLLEPQTATAASLQNYRVTTHSSQASFDTVRPLVTEKESMLGVSLSSAARVRFERLKDLIDLYALREVEEYLKQKDSLVAMNFQLIAIKESRDVERLTRITLFLTKITILFLPVSLMTAYFTVPFHEVLYSLTDYWSSFALVLFLSFGALFVFGVFSGSLQTAAFWNAVPAMLSTTADWIRRHL